MNRDDAVAAASASDGGIPRPIAAALVASVPVDDVTADEAITMIDAFVVEGRATGRSFQIATINVDFVVNARRDRAVLHILQRADLCLADGMPIVWYAKLVGVALRERVAGADLVPKLVDYSRRAGWRVMLFGSAAGVAESAADLLAEQFPGAILRGISGPMMKDVRAMDRGWLDEIASFQPDVICVALGNPKQEKWIDEYRPVLGASVLIGVGGTLDFLVGGRRRAPERMQRSGLEWVYRAAQEPRRLGRRYLRDAFVFAPHLIRAALAGSKSATAGSGPSNVKIDQRSGGAVVDMSGAVLRPRDVSVLVGRARDCGRAGDRLRLLGCSPEVTNELEHLDILELFKRE